VESFNGSLLFEPWAIKTNGGGPFQVFTPFWRACLAAEPPAPPLAAAKRIVAPEGAVVSDTLGSWRLLPVAPDWAGGLRETWTAGEAAARRRLADFLDEKLAAYREERDRPDLESTSRLSPYLAWGEISPRQIWHAARHADAGGRETGKFLSELGWREFSWHLLYHHGSLPEENFRPAFDRFPWAGDEDSLAAWQAGRTGYPIVDAGMRQLWRTGWMHNRVRMVAASFLVKHLLVHWRAGEEWFWDTLVDADLANNAASWQWVAGSGADAAPYFRIFNPVLQGERFDPAGDYVRRFVPELARLPDAWIHKPWLAPASVLGAADVNLGTTYPRPLVEHDGARRRALAAFQAMRDDDDGGRKVNA
jgi:deoxyribodipyrimidine photo-lyase